MITVTFGNGGTLSSYEDIFNYIIARTPLSDDYTFNQVGDTIETSAGESSIDLNNHSITITTLSNKKGNPNIGYTVQLNSNIRIYSRFYNGTYTINGIHFKRVQNNTTGTPLIHFANANPSITYIVKNCIFEGRTTTNTGLLDVGVYIGSINSGSLKLFNCKIFNLSEGLTTWFGNSGSCDIQNCSVHRCTRGCYYTGRADRVTVKNIVFYDNGIDRYYSNPDVLRTGHWMMYNCADTDGSVVALPATSINCITNTTASDFLSVIKTDNNYLNLPVTVNFTTSQLEYFVEDNVTFIYSQSCLSSLYQTGSTSILSENNTDITGQSRPDDLLQVSIGAHELDTDVSYSWNLDDSKTSTNKNPITSYNILGEKDIEVTVLFLNIGNITVLKEKYLNIVNPQFTFTGIPTQGNVSLAVNFTAVKY